MSKPAFKVGDRVCVRADPLARGSLVEVDALTGTFVDANGRHCVYYISSLELEAEPPTMGFKVGDVVRYRNAKAPGKVMSIPGPGQVDVHVAGLTYYSVDPADLWLVSRPSDPLATKAPRIPVGTRVRVEGNPAGEGVIAPEGGYTSEYNGREYVYMVQMPGYDHPISYPAYAVYEIKSAPPALKVGETAEVDALMAKYAAAGRPIQYETAVAYVQGQWEMKGPPPVVASEWMPAGTYMPLKTQEAKPLRSPYAGRYQWKPGAPGCGLGEQGPGISKSIPNSTRRFPSRTLTWGNLGDDYDLLPDAE